MSQALTLTEAAERLAPVFVEESGSSFPVAEKLTKGKWMSLESAAAVLSERVTGQQVTPKKARTEVTVQQAARQIEQPETSAELAEIRAKRLIATAASVQSWQDLEGFINQATRHYQGVDEATLRADPQYHEVYSYAQQLRMSYDAAQREWDDTWAKQCEAENEAFLSQRPDWSPGDARRVFNMLVGLGVTEQEIDQLWRTPQPIDVTSPICLAICQYVAGTDNSIQAALGAVGFEDEEIKAVMSGQAEILLRDHRIQELVARAADADTATKNRAAA